MKNLKTVFVVMLGLLSAGCTRLGMQVLNAPTHTDNVQVTQGIAYGALPEQKLDVYVPSHALGTKLDVVVFLYGGRWESGARGDYRFAGSSLAQQDFIVVMPDYRKYPAVRFPDFVTDAAKAVAWTHNHIAAYGGDAGRIHVAGHSAGAHIGALLATDNRYLAANGKSRNVIKSFVGMAGPYAFTPDEDDLEDMFGPPANYPNMQATTFVDGHEPPMLLLYGDADTLVKPINLERMITAIKAKGGCYQSITYPGIGHVDLVVALSWYGKRKAPVLQDMADYMHRADGCKP